MHKHVYIQIDTSYDYINCCVKNPNDEVKYMTRVQSWTSSQLEAN